MVRQEQFNAEDREAASEVFEQEGQFDPSSEIRTSPAELRRMKEEAELLDRIQRAEARRELDSYFEQESPKKVSMAVNPKEVVRYEPVKPEGAVVRGIKFIFSPATEVIKLFNGTVNGAKNIIESITTATSKIFRAGGHVVEETGLASGNVIEGTGEATGKTIRATGNVVEQGGKVVVEAGRTTEEGLKTTTNIGKTLAAITGKIAKFFGG